MIADRLLTLVARIPEARVLVVGDLMMDAFIWGRVDRISPEAPVPVVRVERDTLLLGGAANVVKNVLALGARAGCCGLVGDDEMGAEIVRRLVDQGADARGVVVAPGRPTTVKTRVIAHHQQVTRIDREARGAPEPAVVERLGAAIVERARDYDVVLLSDYNKGVFTPALVERVLPALLAAGARVVVDPKPQNLALFAGVLMVTPNHHEAERAAGFDIVDAPSLARAGREILARLGCEAVLITRGEAGMSLFTRYGTQTDIPTVAKEVFDVTGAGDTVLGTLGAALAVGADFADAARLANVAAGQVVRHVGTATVAPDELRAAVGEAAAAGDL